MAEVTLVGESARTTGSSESRRLRAAGRIPAVVYGHGIEPASISVNGRDLRIALSGESGVNQLINLDLGSTKHLALARVLQRHPVRNTVIHVDFQVVSRNEVITAEVPVTIVGEAKAVAQENGVVDHVLTSLTVHAKPADIPNGIEVDITDLTVGEAIRVGSLTLPSGVTTDVDDEEVIVSATHSAVAAEVEAADSGEAEGEAGEEAAAAAEAGSEDAEG